VVKLLLDAKSLHQAAESGHLEVGEAAAERRRIDSDRVF